MSTEEIPKIVYAYISFRGRKRRPSEFGIERRLRGRRFLMVFLGESIEQGSSSKRRVVLFVDELTVPA